MDASQFLNYKNWVVVGDVLNPSKYAYKILNSLKKHGFNVVGVNPSIENEGIYTTLSDIPYKVEVLDLCINPYKGIKILHEAHDLKIDKVLIQPGAESPEIINFCKSSGMQVIDGCALVELSKI
ncbi:CoA-binding protein [Clostridium sp. CM028]|uniref:CoA-binding protein n=1 Tax=unclassified Clostridium TaxID=2614128 RepID=UPI001C0DDEF0|nr:MULTISPECIES: CoA-binding protein [unclassified Clostridium]MBU3093125.1 CoA-binding protein [Clostridium sp. CF011]MBW9147178.1 CoA-binding protein [Clostridium sp. CM027]MBW9150305.1 CoA-binding protein [Clostridium sp. CM028]UVE39532.1 CoA-binding protein [Clostridium sp. CM027]WAG68447.1 CoA-binding protein [Clostridium sp. CF011]